MRGSDTSTVGIGLSLAFPSGTSIKTPRDNPGRYHIVTASAFTGYLTPSVGWRPTPGLRIGAGPVLCVSRLAFVKRVDLAPALQTLTPSTPPVYPEQPLLEGEFEVKNAIGYAPSFTAGVLYDIGDVATIGASFIAGSRVNIKGRSRLQPSLDFNVYSEADFSLSQNLPPYVNVGARVRPSPALELSFEGQWAGWSAAHEGDLVISNSRLKSDQADVDALITTLGINEGQLVAGILDKDLGNPRGYQDGWNAVAGAAYRVVPAVLLRGELGFFRATIPDSYIQPSNLDFDNFMAGAGAVYGAEHYEVGLSLYQYFNQGRQVDNSFFSTHSPRGPSYQYPTGNGKYKAQIARAVLEATFRF